MRLPSLMKRTVLSNRDFLARTIRILMVSLNINGKTRYSHRNDDNIIMHQSML